MISLKEITEILNSAAAFAETKNYYYETHICESGETIKVPMNYKFKDEIKCEIIMFGVCPECGTCFYHNDFESN